MKGWVATYSNRPTQANLPTRWDSKNPTHPLERQSSEAMENVPQPLQRLSVPATKPAENSRL